MGATKLATDGLERLDVAADLRAGLVVRTGVGEHARQVAEQLRRPVLSARRTTADTAGARRPSQSSPGGTSGGGAEQGKQRLYEGVRFSFCAVHISLQGRVCFCYGGLRWQHAPTADLVEGRWLLDQRIVVRVVGAAR